MKTIKQQTKLMICLFALILGVNISAQEDAESAKMFIRVYNLEGNKIAKGYVIIVNDTILGLKNNMQIPIQNIGFIRTKRSAGYNVLIGAGLGAVIGVVAGVGSSDPDSLVFSYSEAEGGVGGGLIGGVSGAAIGGLTSLFKNSEKFVVSGDPLLWKHVKEMIIKGE